MAASGLLHCNKEGCEDWTSGGGNTAAFGGFFIGSIGIHHKLQFCYNMVVRLND